MIFYCLHQTSPRPVGLPPCHRKTMHHPSVAEEVESSYSHPNKRLESHRHCDPGHRAELAPKKRNSQNLKRVQHDVDVVGNFQWFHRRHVAAVGLAGWVDQDLFSVPANIIRGEWAIEETVWKAEVWIGRLTPTHGPSVEGMLVLSVNVHLLEERKVWLEPSSRPHELDSIKSLL